MTHKCRYLEDLLHSDIPLTKALNLTVQDWQNHRLVLKLPIQNNINHMHSMFGGSLYCGSVLAGWGWLHLRLQEAGIDDGHIVIQEGAIEYLHPVHDDALAVCEAPEDKLWTRFEALYRRRGRSRIMLNSRIITGEGQDAVRFSGQYVLHN